MIKYLEYLPGWMAHQRGMVQDMRQGGKEKHIENSVNICDATLLVSQNHVADLGQGCL